MSNRAINAAFETQPFLIAEDSDDDALLLQRAFEKGQLPNPLLRVRDGMECVAYLKGETPFSDRGQWPFPAVLLLDLHMPQANGFQVLDWIRKQPDFRKLVIAAYTSSSREEDATKVHALGGNFYLTKPPRFEQLVQMITSLHAWVKANHFPPGPSAAAALHALHDRKQGGLKPHSPHVP